MKRISLKAMENTVKDVCTKYFDFDFDSLNIPVEITDRPTNSLGEFVYDAKEYKPIAIEFSNELVSGIYKVETVESVIKHEIVHLVLMMKGEGFHDKTKNFEEVVEQIGGTTSKVIRPLVYYYAKCSCCGKRCLSTFSKAVYKRYTNSECLLSNCCNSKLVPDGETIYKDETKFKNEDAGELLRKNIENEQSIDDNIIISPNTHLVASKTGQVKINKTTLRKTLNYYIDQKDDDEIKFLYKNFKDEFINGYKDLTKKRMVYVDSILKEV